MLESSKEILDRAIVDIKPYAIVAMISGGKDSLSAYFVARQLGVKITHIVHGVTRTGITETTEFVRNFSEKEKEKYGLVYLEADAKDRYESYLRRKGFFGIGRDAHNFSYHILKHQVFSTCVAHNIRLKQRNRPVLLLNGARMQESSARSKKIPEPIRKDSPTNNYWVNPLHYWTRQDRDTFLGQIDAPVNPVTEKLCRSGECLCGTAQSLATREEASFFYPKWGSWLDNLEKEVKSQFGFGWGEAAPKTFKSKKLDFQPMCVSCQDDLEQVVIP